MILQPEQIPGVKLANGDRIPCMGMGTFGSDNYSPEEIAEAVRGALLCGYRLFDCASVYGNEDRIGEVFTWAMTQGMVKREELFITSKVWNDQHGEVEKAFQKAAEIWAFPILTPIFCIGLFPIIMRRAATETAVTRIVNLFPQRNL